MATLCRRPHTDRSWTRRETALSSRFGHILSGRAPVSCGDPAHALFLCTLQTELHLCYHLTPLYNLMSPNWNIYFKVGISLATPSPQHTRPTPWRRHRRSIISSKPKKRVSPMLSGCENKEKHEDPTTHILSRNRPTTHHPDPVSQYTHHPPPISCLAIYPPPRPTSSATMHAGQAGVFIESGTPTTRQ